MMMSTGMQTFAVFGVGLGNLGASRRKRVKASRWVVELNRLLKAASAPATVVASYGHTGNFIVQSMAKRKAVCQTMGQVLGTSCAALTISELQALAETLKKFKKTARLPRYTLGAVIQVLGAPIRTTPSPTTRAKYQRFTDFIVIARKREITTSTGALDPNRRNGGWGALATEISKKLGGRWTARSRRTIAGSLRCALMSGS
jgi:hypothetical protein